MNIPFRSLVTAAAAAATFLATIAPSGPAHAQPADVKNVVLVHGAFADGSGWRGVYDELVARGYRVTIVQNPLTSLSDDISATQRVIDRQDGPTVLVGHSYGGTVITEVGVDPKVTGLVYVSGLAPDAGETTSQQYADYPTPPSFVIETGSDDFGFVNMEKFKAGFAGDTTDEVAAFLRDSQVPINMSIFDETLTQAAWRTKPSWAVVATADEAIDPRMLRQTAERVGAEITEIDASHVVFLTHPRAVADVIDRAAKESGQA
ncbi:alpha/beta fold hydrolase [Mycolicibacterium diernhoferi]|uniref:Alpha/beta hydrolase n=1 Tax=Mycolicibacterium diernhoferi TaxID=1801 RepID=A0A1Q4HJB9_9MYCO|nr:alpha/beta hydrolase [Mycolicibacterium diernhoferi]OJZ67597.1 alpha/beta hydrolase [Mycolicibacterium diernhoferi]OPE55400.1 alpha/beta hydrolase [Mycolicibacterium diernhoferi]PEG55866.1 alpha/beta hydrolase [Mycolicibacterium diernhoferi]QYL25248.1 alpha/beta hydrolase [Mycolicibacterium diernhoferi]